MFYLLAYGFTICHETVHRIHPWQRCQLFEVPGQLVPIPLAPEQLLGAGVSEKRLWSSNVQMPFANCPNGNRPSREAKSIHSGPRLFGPALAPQ